MKIIYNCFKGKCTASTEYVYGEHVSKNFKELMETIGVQIPLNAKFSNKKAKVQSLDLSKYEEHSYKTLTLPEDTVAYNPDKHWWFRELLEERCIEFDRPLRVGTDGEWNHKLLVPCYYEGRLIGWQGVSHYKGKTFYLTSSGNSDIMYINNRWGNIPESPIVVEGLMDAGVLPDAVAIFGNRVSKKQAYMLRNSNPILLPDRKDSKFIEDAKRYGWRIAIPEWKMKDANAAIQVYGKFTVAKMIHDGIQDNHLKAEVRYNLWRTR